MLTNLLNTNEIKNAAGTEQEFQSQGTDGRSHSYSLIGESPALPHRLRISHLESGAGLKLTRRSMVRFDKTVQSTVDAATPVTISAYAVVQLPVGAMVSDAEFKNVLANLVSFLASNGSDTTIKFDGSGTGSAVLLAGSI